MAPVRHGGALGTTEEDGMTADAWTMSKGWEWRRAGAGCWRLYDEHGGKLMRVAAGATGRPRYEGYPLSLADGLSGHGGITEATSVLRARIEEGE